MKSFKQFTEALDRNKSLYGRYKQLQDLTPEDKKKYDKYMNPKVQPCRNHLRSRRNR